jgi:hypothetical protein
MIERFHPNSKEEEIWLNEYRSLEEARELIGPWIEEYNHDAHRRSRTELHAKTAPASHNSNH